VSVASIGHVVIDEAAELLFGVMSVGDDRCVDETWIAGKCAYRKDVAEPLQKKVSIATPPAPVVAVVNSQSTPVTVSI